MLVKHYWSGLWKCPFNSGVLEGMNNRIKVIKRIAYGFGDKEYPFLKIKYAFTGKCRRAKS